MKLPEKKFDPETTLLSVAKAYLKDRAKQGASCPCCDQWVQLYEREIHGSMARVLIILHRHFLRENPMWIHVPSFLEDLSVQLGAAVRGGDWAKLRYWGLIEEKPKETKPAKRKDGSKRVGFYRVTEKGHAFAKGEIKVPRAALVYNERHLGFSADREVSIVDCLGKEFNYDELMSGKYVDAPQF